MRVKKSLGQHFLKSERALRLIVEAGNVSAEDTILEIGPGTGALTEKILETRTRKVIAVEKDNTLFEFLKQKFEKEIKNGKLELIHDDILKFDLSKIAADSYKLIANIPYNITGAILKKFLESPPAGGQPKTMVLLVQKEVAKRIVGEPLGSLASKLGKKESILSLSVKAYGEPRYIKTVRAGSFAPAPKVDSAIIVIENISKAFFQKMARASDVDTECQRIEKGFFEMVRAGFKSKRKKLSSNLATVFEKDKVSEMFEKLGLDENLRAEDVKIGVWHKLAKSLLKPKQNRG